MADTGHIIKLLFLGGVDPDEARQKGYLSHVAGEVDGSTVYPVFFFSKDRLGGELRMASEDGQPYITGTGMIVVPEITLDTMQIAVEGCYKAGFFRHLVPLTREELANIEGGVWPPERPRSQEKRL
ncbi:MAG: hypothetical protein ACHRHE_07170 [Tepidisphaerales bacterium]